MENFPYTFEITKQTARDICRARRAIVETDKAKLSTWERRIQAEELNPNVATLRIDGAVNLTVPIRCDILAKWTAAHDYDTFQFEVAESLAVTIRANGSTLKLLAPQFPAGVLPIKANNAFVPELVTDFDVSTTCLTAKTLRARIAEAKKDGVRISMEKKAAGLRKAYNEALSLLTPENIHRATKRSCHLRNLKRWVRLIQDLPETVSILSLPDHPLLSCIDSETWPSLAAFHAKWITAKRRFDTYAPRSFYSGQKESQRREKLMKQARGMMRSTFASGINWYVRAFGFSASWYGETISLYDNNTEIQHAKRIVRKFGAEMEIEPAGMQLAA